jgi:hypothetical protein
MQIRQLAALLCLTVACGDKSTDDTGDAAAFTPGEGEWVLDTPSVDVDACSLEAHLGEFGEGSTSTLVMTGDLDFDLTDERGEVDTCTLSGTAFACDTLTTEDDTPSGSGLRATILVESTTSGTFGDDGTVSIETVVHMECDGVDCEGIEATIGASFPCDLELSQSGTLSP